MQTALKHKSELGQFFTPKVIADFMASLFMLSGREQEKLSILDAGAGEGQLSIALLTRLKDFAPATVTAIEFDDAVIETLASQLEVVALAQGGAANVVHDDFIARAAYEVSFGKVNEYDLAILNPPYKKLNVASKHYRDLAQVGLATTNFYTAFVSLALRQLKPGGQMVAIIPRSFCNGPYFKSFRTLMLKLAALRHVHIFRSRDKAFNQDGVLQENIIIHLQKGVTQQEVCISWSEGSEHLGAETIRLPFDAIVKPNDPELFIHIPEPHLTEQSCITFQHTLSDLGVQVSTGSVVDFRMKDDLRMDIEQGAVPLLYPTHLGSKYIHWPKPGSKKPNALMLNERTAKALYPSGYYTVVKRFSSKEEKKRIVARVLQPTATPIGFENHLNVFHQNKQGISFELALGLAVFLNSTMIDHQFRQFNGHTQVNATDLRSLKYPSLDILLQLGAWSKDLESFDQVLIDQKISTLI